MGIYHCFGCGEGGDVISFLKKMDHTTFPEAVEKLAARIGFELRYEDGGSGPNREEVGRRQRLLDAHKVADEFFRAQLLTPGAAEGRNFLHDRGFDRAAAEQFGVGYAPQGWDSLLKHLRGKGYTDPELKLTGMFSEGGRGIYDRFRGRLIWPIRDIAGDTIGFGARKLYEDDQGPKYLNTPETALYKKSQVLYGIDLAKRNIAKDRQLVVVEGYTDVMACHLAGIPTAVATCGTAFGTEHIKIARRLLSDDGSGGEVIFTFDGDAAGQKAALRAFEEDQRFVAQTYVAVEPNGADPCELRQSKGDAAVRDLIGTRRPLFEFAIRAALKRHNLDTVEGRIAALRESAPVVAQIRDAGIRPAYARELAGWLGMPVEEVSRAVGAAAKRAAQPPSGSAGPARTRGRAAARAGYADTARDPRRELRPCRRRPPCRPSTGRTRETPWPRWNGRRWRLPCNSPECWKARPGSVSPRRGSRRRRTWPSTRPSGPTGWRSRATPCAGWSSCCTRSRSRCARWCPSCPWCRCRPAPPTASCATAGTSWHACSSCRSPGSRLKRWDSCSGWTRPPPRRSSSG